MLRKRNLGSIEDIAEEEESDAELSPQGKQRKTAMFQPGSAKMARSGSVGDEPQITI